MREILPLVQTALIRLYLEDDQDGDQSIQEFFKMFGNGGDYPSNHLMLLEKEMLSFIEQPQFKEKQVTLKTAALFYEHKGQYQSALDIWAGMKTDQQNANERIIQILKKSGGTKDWITNYGKKVFLEAPDVALKLFKND